MAVAFSLTILFHFIVIFPEMRPKKVFSKTGTFKQDGYIVYRISPAVKVLLFHGFIKALQWGLSRKECFKKRQRPFPPALKLRRGAFFRPSGSGRFCRKLIVKGIEFFAAGFSAHTQLIPGDVLTFPAFRDKGLKKLSMNDFFQRMKFAVQAVFLFR